VNGEMEHKVKGGRGTGKDITGCSVQDFGTSPVIIKNFFNIYLN
jgi:hypothetical protein